MSTESEPSRSRSATVIADDDALFAELYPRLRRFAAVVGSPHDDPDDLVQEALALALRRGPLRELTNPLAYLRTTISNLNSNRGRTRGRQARAIVRLQGDDGQPAIYPSDVDFLMELTPLDRAIVFCAAVESMPYRDIAEMLSLSERATAKRAERALQRLRRTMRGANDGR